MQSMKYFWSIISDWFSAPSSPLTRISRLDSQPNSYCRWNSLITVIQLIEMLKEVNWVCGFILCNFPFCTIAMWFICVDRAEHLMNRLISITKAKTSHKSHAASDATVASWVFPFIAPFSCWFFLFNPLILFSSFWLFRALKIVFMRNKVYNAMRNCRYFLLLLLLFQ